MHIHIQMHKHIYILLPRHIYIYMNTFDTKATLVSTDSTAMPAAATGAQYERPGEHTVIIRNPADDLTPSPSGTTVLYRIIDLGLHESNTLNIWVNILLLRCTIYTRPNIIQYIYIYTITIRAGCDVP